MKNEILQEVWRNRDEFAREHNYDIDAMVVPIGGGGIERTGNDRAAHGVPHQNRVIGADGYRHGAHVLAEGLHRIL